MSLQLGATLVGGMLSVLGGFAATRFWRWRDSRMKKREGREKCVGAINLVLAELAANHANLSRAVESGRGSGQLRVFDSAYAQVELLLAERLRADVGKALFRVYAPIRAGDLYLKRSTRSDSADQRVDINLNECARLLPLLQEADAGLRRAATDLAPGAVLVVPPLASRPDGTFNVDG